MGLIDDLREVRRRLYRKEAAEAIDEACDGLGIPYGIKGDAFHGDDLASVLVEISARIKREFIPVPLGKDGRRLEVGRHYFGSDGRAWMVLGFRPNRTYDVVGQCGDEVNQYLKGVWLMSERPDTQERIDADKEKSTIDYWGCSNAACDECPAMVDGKRPYERYGIRSISYNSCVVAQGYDLALRQARLDGRA